MSKEIEIDITCDISDYYQEYICEIVADFLDDKGIEWYSSSFKLIAEYVPENGGWHE